MRPSIENDSGFLAKGMIVDWRMFMGNDVFKWKCEFTCFDAWWNDVYKRYWKKDFLKSY